MAYNYMESMVSSIMDAFNEYEDWAEIEDREDLEEQMYEDLWVDDSVTGNGSGSYWFNREKAREALRGNEDLLVEAIEEFGDNLEDYKKALTESETADVYIRCYLLSQAISKVLDDLGY